MFDPGSAEPVCGRVHAKSGFVKARTRFSGSDQSLVIGGAGVDPRDISKDMLLPANHVPCSGDLMASFFKDLWTRFAGGESSSAASEPAAEAVEYKGFRIKPAPYSSKGQYQTAGIIEKDSGAGPKEHRFVRAETHASKDDAIAFAIVKAKQIIDEQGERIFD